MARHFVVYQGYQDDKDKHYPSYGGKFKKEEMNIQEHHMVSDLITVVVRAKIGAGNDSR